MPKLTNPHDRFFREAFSRPDRAADLLRNYLPPEVAALLDLTPSAIELASGSFVDSALRQHFTDLLFIVRTRAGQAAYVYVLLEHKSHPEAFVALQLLRYMLRIWLQQRRTKAPRLHPSVPFRLYPIIPVVVYHGKARWNVPVNFGALFGASADLPDPIRRYLPEFEYHLLDVSPERPPAAVGAADLRVVLRALREITSRRLGKDLAAVLAPIRERGEVDEDVRALIALVLQYVSIARPDVPPKDMEAAVETVFEAESGEVMTSVYEMWVEKGIQRGRQEGKMEGLMTAIQSVLAARFGAVPAEVQAALRGCSLDRLQALLPVAGVCGSIDEFAAAL